MKNLLSFLKPAPHIEEIKDQKLVTKEYFYWRIRILYSMFIGYALYYFTRKSFTYAMPTLILDLGFDKSDLGLSATFLSLSYGASKFVSGVLGDKSSPRYFMALGLILTGVFNIFFGLSSTPIWFAIFWGLNGWFQGFGWPPCARFLTQWYSHSERGRWWSIWNISHNAGSILIIFIAAFCCQYVGWRFAMFLPGVICIFGGLFLVNRLRDTPESLGLPPIEKFRNDYAGAAPSENDRELSTKEILFEFVLKNKFIWILAISYFFVYVVRTGINDWGALYLIEEKGYTVMSASICVFAFEAGGILGSLLAGWSSDKLFGGRRGPINVIFSAGMVVSLAFFWWVPIDLPYLNTIAMFLIGVLVFGPQMLIGVAAAELSHKNAAATATGFAGCFAYVGAASAGYPLAKITQEYGWEGCFWALAVCGVVATLLLAPLWAVHSKMAKKTKPQVATAKGAEPEPA